MTQTDLTVERVRHPLKMRVLTVARVERIAGLLARVTFRGEDLRDFVSASFDDHVKLFFPADPSQPLALPEVGPDGIKFPEGAPRPAARDYTRAVSTPSARNWTSISCCTATARPRAGPNRRKSASAWVSAARAVRSWCPRALTGTC